MEADTYKTTSNFAYKTESASNAKAKQIKVEENINNNNSNITQIFDILALIQNREDRPSKKTRHSDSQTINSNHSNVANDFLFHRNVSYNGPSLSLKEIRNFGWFLNNPPNPVNSLTLEDVYDAELRIYKENDEKEGKYIISKKGKILAKSPGLEILPQCPPTALTKILGTSYDHGNNVHSDQPCKEQADININLNKKKGLSELMSYLNGIPAYNPEKIEVKLSEHFIVCGEHKRNVRSTRKLLWYGKL